MTSGISLASRSVELERLTSPLAVDRTVSRITGELAKAMIKRD